MFVFLYTILSSDIWHLEKWSITIFGLILFLQNEINTEQVPQIKIVGQQEILQWLYDKIEQALIVSAEEKSWPVT